MNYKELSNQYEIQGNLDCNKFCPTFRWQLYRLLKPTRGNFIACTGMNCERRVTELHPEIVAELTVYNRQVLTGPNAGVKAINYAKRFLIDEYKKVFDSQR